MNILHLSVKNRSILLTNISITVFRYIVWCIVTNFHYSLVIQISAISLYKKFPTYRKFLLVQRTLHLNGLLCRRLDKKLKKWINQQKRVIYEMHLQASARFRVAKSYNECVLIRRREKGYDVKSLARQFNALAHEIFFKYMQNLKIPAF